MALGSGSPAFYRPLTPAWRDFEEDVMPRRSILLLAGACLLIAIGVGIFAAMALSRPSGGRAGEVVSMGEAQIGGPFELVNHDGQAVDESILNGKWSLVFF